jgi:hypothetical protein
MIPIGEAEIDRLIAEDVGFGDLTTRALGIAGRPGRISFAARDPMVACATEEAGRILARLGAVPLVSVKSSTAVTPGTMLLEATGDAAALHAGWKVAQTLIEWSASIASAVREIRDAARAVTPAITVACTRKSVPLTRALSIKAVLSGGGAMHCTGLGDTILVFPEHRAFLARGYVSDDCPPAGGGSGAGCRCGGGVCGRRAEGRRHRRGRRAAREVYARCGRGVPRAAGRGRSGSCENCRRRRHQRRQRRRLCKSRRGYPGDFRAVHRPAARRAGAYDRSVTS